MIREYSMDKYLIGKIYLNRNIDLFGDESKYMVYNGI